MKVDAFHRNAHSVNCLAKSVWDNTLQ